MRHTCYTTPWDTTLLIARRRTRSAHLRRPSRARFVTPVRSRSVFLRAVVSSHYLVFASEHPHHDVVIPAAIDQSGLALCPFDHKSRLHVHADRPHIVLDNAALFQVYESYRQAVSRQTKAFSG